jgi:hypothetical protein
MKPSNFVHSLRNAVMIVGILIVLVVIGVLIWIFSNQPMNQAEIDKRCIGFYKELESSVNSLGDYKVTNGSKECALPRRKDEPRSHSVLSVSLRVESTKGNSEDVIKASVSDLSDRLPMAGYPIHIENISDEMKSKFVCIWSDRALDDRGKDIQQVSPRHHPHYVTPNAVQNNTGCKGL